MEPAHSRKVRVSFYPYVQMFHCFCKTTEVAVCLCLSSTSRVTRTTKGRREVHMCSSERVTSMHSLLLGKTGKQCLFSGRWDQKLLETLPSTLTTFPARWQCPVKWCIPWQLHKHPWQKQMEGRVQ